jgi:hypothetical protein
VLNGIIFWAVILKNMAPKKQSAKAKKEAAPKKQSIDKLREQHPFETDSQIQNRYGEGTVKDEKKAGRTELTRMAGEAITRQF